MSQYLTILYHALAVVGALFTTKYFYKMVKLFIDIKDKRIYKYIASISMIFVPIVVIFVSDLTNVLFTLFWFLMIVIICYKGTIIQKISTVMILYPIVVNVNFLMRYIPVSFKNGALDNMCWIYTIAIFWYVLYRYTKDKIASTRQYINSKTWLLLDLINIAPFLNIIITIIWTNYDEQYKAKIIAILCLLSNIGILLLIKFIVDSVKIKLENKNYKIQYDYYQLLENEQLNTRKIYHDMNNNLQVIGNFIENGDKKDALKYIMQISKSTEIYRNKKFCNNHIVNAVLNNKMMLISKNHIDCKINISIQNLIALDDLDLCSLFANTIDNAIDASLKISDSKKRQICIKVRTKNNFFIYSIKNNKANDIVKKEGRIISNKPNSKMHGFGIQNVKEIINKYNGTFDINYTDKEFEIVTIING
ncbi:GHKL domain-containing protein [Clostridiaceae bacterium M8S5]|nr:GHKL domain-containing protein [Clostridiaceae bacterium M8S5]